MKDSESEPGSTIVYTNTSDIQTMKKFMKDKMGLNSQGEGEQQIRLKTEVMEDYDSAMHKVFGMNPPLPPNDHFGKFIIPKQEVNDNDNTSITLQPVKAEPREMMEPVEQPPPLPVPIETPAAPTNGGKDEPEVCRDFLRQNCTRAKCTFRHEYDNSKIRILYKFCKDFQNKGCTYPVCKYAHATVFEQEYYYKTSYLPPAALSHQKQNNKEKGPLRVKPVVNGVTTSWRKTPPPPPQVNGDDVMMNAIKIKPATPMDGINPVSSPLNGSRDTALTNGDASLKRAWTDMSELNMPLRGQDVKRTPLNCESCMLLENRVHRMNLKLQSMYNAKDEYARKSEILEDQETKMRQLIVKFLYHLSAVNMETINSDAQWQGMVTTTKPC